jgi:amino acid transporter
LIIFKVWRRELWFGVHLNEIDVDKGRRFAGMELLPPPEDTSDFPWWKRALTAVF